MFKKYSGHYQLEAILAKDPSILPAFHLYNVNIEKIHAASLDMLAQPIDGVESPFSSRNPLSAHGQIMGAIAYLHALIGHEINLVPDSLWVRWFRLLGVEMGLAERPVINLVFRRSPDAIASGIPAKVPLGTEVKSIAGEIATTVYDLYIDEDSDMGEVPARLDRPGKISMNIWPGEFSVIPDDLNWIDSVSNTEVLFEGKEPETLPEAMLRARQAIQSAGNLVNPRDYYRAALDLGASKVNFLPRVKKGSKVQFANLVTVAVYPPGIAKLIQPEMTDRELHGINVEVIPAEIIPIAGEIDVRIVPTLSNDEAFNLAATAIQKNINPPFGVWGDRTFPRSLAIALENQPNFSYSVPRVNLKHADTGAAIELLAIERWNLLEIQQNLVINWIR
jgi:hypothetical protein